MHSISNKNIMLYLFYWRGLVVYHRRHPSSSFVVVSCCPCPRRIFILFTSSYTLIIVVVVIVIPVRRHCLVLSASCCHIRLLSPHYSISAYWRRAPRGPRRTSSEVSCTSGDLRHCAPQCSQPFAYGTSQRSRPFANGKNRRSIFHGFKTICKRELYANGR